MRTLLVHQGEKPLIGILEDGQLAEVFFPQEGDTAEAVLLGRVERIVPGMKAAFVDIGQEKNGFLATRSLCRFARKHRASRARSSRVTSACAGRRCCSRP